MREISVAMHFPLAPPQLAEHLTDDGYLQRRYDTFGGRSLDVARLGDHVVVTLHRLLPVDDVPAAARGLLPADGILIQTETWTLGKEPGATFTVDAPGQPVTLTGNYTLNGDATGTALTVTGQLRVAVPLLGGTIESLAAPNITRLISAELELALGEL